MHDPSVDTTVINVQYTALLYKLDWISSKDILLHSMKKKSRPGQGVGPY